MTRNLFREVYRGEFEARPLHEKVKDLKEPSPKDQVTGFSSYLNGLEERVKELEERKGDIEWRVDSAVSKRLQGLQDSHSASTVYIWVFIIATTILNGIAHWLL